MTAQFNDMFRYGNKKYSLAGISEGEIFDISTLGLNPVMASTACWRGYQAVFAVVSSRLVLDSLYVNLQIPGGGSNRQREAGPAINGVSPSPPREGFGFFNNHYVGLNYPLKYTGGLLLADGFIESLYVHMGFHPAWKYKTVVELVFEAGVLSGEFDRSEQMAKVRDEIIKANNKEGSRKVSSEEEISQFVKRAFNRRY
jgi:hypothetical protein